jgi:hypothetical protein
MAYRTIALSALSAGAKPAGQTLGAEVQMLVERAAQTASWAHGADNLLRLLTWQNPLLWVVLAAALLAPRRLPAVAWALLGGIILTVVATLLLMPAQGHGWGYRYLHGMLGSLALLGAFGWKRIHAELPQVDRWLPVSAAVSLLLLLPVRAWQAETFARPWRQADARIEAVDADIVLIEHRGRWFANDLVRNDPYLNNRPLRLLAGKLSATEAGRLCHHYRVRVLSWTSPELQPLRPTALRGERVQAVRTLRRLNAAGCG